MRRARAAAVERGRQRAEHADILVALLDSDDATRVLGLFVDDPGEIRTGLSFITMYALPWSAETDSEERTVDQARAEAAALGHTSTGPEHLLLGLAGQMEAVTAGLLLALGLSIETARQAVRHVHGEAPDWQPPEEPESLPPASASMTMRAMNRLVPGITEEEADSMRDALMAPFMAGSSRLERVVAIGQTAEVSGVLVEMIALEVREAGGVLLWRTQTAEERLLGAADIAITDDVGTHYSALPGSWSGSGRESRGETQLAPRPPDAAQILKIVVRSFGPMQWPAPLPRMALPIEEGAGPWRFEVPIGRS